MFEWMLEDAARACDFRYVALRYLQLHRADPQGHRGQSTPMATYFINGGVVGLYPQMESFGQDYPTRDDACVHDYIQVTDLRTLGRIILKTAVAAMGFCGFSRCGCISLARGGAGRAGGR